MKAFVLERTGESEKAFVLREVPEPTPAASEYLIKVEAFGLNFADVMARKGAYRDAPPRPCVIGYDVVGRVEKAPENGLYTPGKRVVALTRFGGYAEKVCARAEAVFDIPEDLSPAEATALATQGATAWHCAVGTGSLYAGDLALVSAAAGGVGSLLVQILKAYGLRVAGLAGGAKRETVLSLGADYFLNRHEGSLMQLWKKYVPDARPDVVFDSAGGRQVREAFRLLNPGGRLVLYGAAASGGTTNPLKLALFAWGFGFYSPIPFIMRSQALAGVNMLRLADQKPQALRQALEGAWGLFREGKLKPLKGHTFSYRQLAEAHRLLESGQSTGKVAVVWD